MDRRSIGPKWTSPWSRYAKTVWPRATGSRKAVPGGSVTSTNFGSTARPSTGPARGRLARDHPEPRALGRLDLGELAALEVPIGRPRHLFRAGRFSHNWSPAMPSGRTCGISSWRMPLPDVIHWMSPAPMLP